MIWFLIGAGVGAGSLAYSLIQRPVRAKSGFDALMGFVVSGGLGALVIGTPLWLIFG
jgi:hypothetical protein